MGNPFTDHPHAAGESYRDHMRVAFGIARQLGGAAIAAAVHGVLPALHTSTASERIHRLHECLESGDRQAIRTAHKPCAEPTQESAPSTNELELSA